MSCSCETTLPYWFNLEPAFYGSTANQTSFKASGDGITSILSDVEMVFSLGGVDVLTLKSGDGILITNSAIGLWSWDMQAIPNLSLEPGFYSYRTETIDTSGIQTIFFTGTWTIK